jgi:hypothetical protein
MQDVCKTCGRMMRIQALGLCRSCYRHKRFEEDPRYAATYRAQERETRHQRRLADEEWRNKQRAIDRGRVRNLTGVCELCGAEGCVAKRLCRRCYNRVKRQEVRAARANDPIWQAKQAERNARKIRTNQGILREAKSHPCMDCKKTFPWWIMELDHVRGVKKFALSKAGTRREEAVREELAKCNLVCPNCHRIRTHIRGAFGGKNKPYIPGVHDMGEIDPNELVA